jgi:hypothetical protein
VQCGLLSGPCPSLSCSLAAPATCLSATTTATPTTAAPPTTATTTAAPVPAACPPGYTQPSATKCWLLSTSQLDWLDALTACIQLGGTLATVQSQQEQVQPV